MTREEFNSRLGKLQAKESSLSKSLDITDLLVEYMGEDNYNKFYQVGRAAYAIGMSEWTILDRFDLGRNNLEYHVAFHIGWRGARASAELNQRKAADLNDT